MRERKDELLYYAHRYQTTTVAQIAPNALEELGRLFHIALEKTTLEAVAAGLHKIGVDYVMDASRAMRQADQLAVEALRGRPPRRDNPVLLSNSFAANRFVEECFGGLKPSLLSYLSAGAWFGRFVKGDFAKAKGLNPANIKTVYITNDNENSAEAAETHCVDFVVNARELYRIFLRSGVDINRLTPVPLDDFGVDCPETPELLALFADYPWDLAPDPLEATIDLGNGAIPAAVARNLGQARRLLEAVAAGTSPYQVIRLLT